MRPGHFARHQFIRTVRYAVKGAALAGLISKGSAFFLALYLCYFSGTHSRIVPLSMCFLMIASVTSNSFSDPIRVFRCRP